MAGDNMTKNQHYVPQFYLRRFSEFERKKQINVYNLHHKKFIIGASIKGQAYKPFFYDNDGTIESYLSKIEYFSSNSIAKLENNPVELANSDIKNLYTFIALSYVRTKKFADEVNMQMEFLRKHASYSSKIHGLDALEEPFWLKNPGLESLSALKDVYDKICDLRLEILINTTERQFIASDNPVIICNNFIIGKKYNYGTGGVALAVTTFILPISPYMIITLYDEDVYEMTTRGIIISDRNHVDILNRFQVANAESNVYYKNRHMEKWITKYANSMRNTMGQKRIKTRFASYEKADANGELFVLAEKITEADYKTPWLAICENNCLKLDITVPFLNIKKTPKYVNYHGRFLRTSCAKSLNTLR